MSALALVSSMPRPRGDTLAAELRVEVWCSTLQDVELVGVLPEWAVIEVARAFVAGLAESKWMPSVGEFLAEVKRRMAPARAALVDMRQILDAPVEVELSEADLAARREMVAAVMATLDPAPAHRDIDQPSDWDRRRADVLPLAAEIDARSAE